MNAKEQETAVKVIKDLLLGGAHDGPCDNEGNESEDGCSLHMEAARKREQAAREFLARIGE